MSDPKSRQRLSNLGAAVERLREALREPVTTDLIVDGTIHRFEFVMELFWKTFKDLLLSEEKVQSHTPREALKEAFRAGWIQDQDAWLDMLRDRNETSHIYSRDMAQAIYLRIRTYMAELDRAHAFLAQRFGPV